MSALREEVAETLALLNQQVSRLLEQPGGYEPGASPEADRLSSPEAIYRRMGYLAHLRQEEFHVLLLNTKGELVCDVMLYRGTVNITPICVAEVFRPAIVEGCPAIIAVHNHPSGDPTPSPEDEELATKLAAAGSLLGIKLLDFIIIGKGKYYSREGGGIEKSEKNKP